LMIMAFLFIIISIIALPEVSVYATTVGAGSFADTLPAGCIGPQAAIYKTSAMTGATQTNSWESSIYWEQWSENLYAHPLRYKCIATGLEVGVPALAASADVVAGGANIDYTIVSSTTPPADARVSKATDWAVDVVMGGMTATIVKGSPYSYYTFTAGMPKLSFQVTPTVWSGNATSQFLGITVNGQNYGLFAPSGSTWTGG
jgi:endoglucanase Acf2